MSKRTRSKPAATEVKNATKRAGRSTLLMAGIILLGLAIRLLPALYVIIGDHVVFSGFDSYYHMRRTVYTVYDYPSVNTFDSYVDFPYGYVVGWPPLFDLLTATAALIAGFGRPDILTIEIAASLVPVLIGAATIPLVYYLARDVLNEKAALISALLFAIIPAGVFRSLFGLVDHHGLEVLLSVALFLFFLRSVNGAKKAGMGFLNAWQARPLIYAALAGATSACMALSWDGAPIFIGIIIAYAFVQYAYDSLKGESSEYLTVPGVAAFALALGIMAPIAVAGGFSMMPAYMAWFQAVFLAGALFFFIAAGLLSVAARRYHMPWYALPAAIAGLAIAGIVAVWLMLPGFVSGVESGLLYLSGMEPVMTTVSEVEMLFISGGKLSFVTPWAFFSLVGPVAVLGLLVFILGLRGKRLNNADVFLLAWTAIVLILGLMQKRFLNVFAVTVSIFGGYALYRTLELAGLEGFLAKNKRSSASRSGSVSTALMAAAIVTVMLLLPALMSSVSLALTPESYVAGWDEACRWVSEHTPQTSFLYSAGNGTHPEYGVMSWWDYGNYILYRAERPAVANNFQTGVEDAAKFFTAQDEASANAIMDERGARYVMLDSRMGSPYAGAVDGIFENMAYLAGDNAYGYHDKTLPASRSANEKYYRTMYARLFYGDDADNGYAIPPLEHYRLIYATQGADPVKVFEYVKEAP